MSTRRGEGPRETTGDLFAHFGIDLNPASPKADALAGSPLVALGCRGCGWFVLASEHACPICGAIGPAAETSKTP